MACGFRARSNSDSGVERLNIRSVKRSQSCLSGTDYYLVENLGLRLLDSRRTMKLMGETLAIQHASWSRETYTSPLDAR